MTRAMMLLRLHTLATGHTGVRPKTAKVLESLLNARITPVVHEYGSLGCSGDLAPLSHVALTIMGEGVVRDAAGERVDAAEALKRAGIEPVELVAKEGSRSSTAPTACSACSSWPWTTSPGCSRSPTSARP